MVWREELINSEMRIMATVPGEIIGSHRIGEICVIYSIYDDIVKGMLFLLSRCAGE
jgi:hypothetical protein